MNTDLHTLSGAYALDALSDEEAKQFRLHLQECSACREEVRELRQAASRMGESEPIPPPSALKERILAAADQLPQLPPKVTRIQQGRSPHRTARIASAAAAAVLVVGTAFGIGLLRSGDEQNGVTHVFQAADAHEARVKTRSGATVTVATSRRLGKMAVDTDALPSLGRQRVYQIWAIHNGTPMSAGLIDDPDRGASMALPSAGTLVAITVEPAGGSRVPTTAPLFQVDPSAV